MRLITGIFTSFYMFFTGSAYCNSDVNVVNNDIEITESIMLDNGYVRETIPGTTISAAYLTLKNTTDKDMLLIGVTSHISKRIELHNHELKSGLMRMRKIDQVVIPANEQVELQPSGMHIMIFDLENGLQANENVQFQLQFLNAKSKEVVLPVRSIKTQLH